VAPRVGSGADELLALFGEVSAAAAQVGAPASDRPSRNERSLGLLGEARVAQDGFREFLGDVLGLVRAWQADPAGCRERFARVEWLLDGWRQVCAAWKAAAAEPRAAQRAVLKQVRLLIPVLDPTGAEAADRVREAARAVSP